MRGENRGNPMKRFGPILPKVVIAGFAVVLGSLAANAGGACLGIRLSCENGRNYLVCPIAVSDAGEIVSASLAVSPHRGVYVRLVPMGVGYRYIGHGVWVNGVDRTAILNFGENRGIFCKAEHY